MVKISIITSGRADFGLLKNLVIKLKKSKFNCSLIATGTHFSKDYGYSYQEIVKNKIKIDKRINIKIETKSHPGISKIISEHIYQTSKIFKKLKPNLVILLGDRYEILASAISAHIAGIPIAHIHGGELTSGAIDDAFRHSITKMSHFHFVSNIIHKKRIIQLGESPNSIFVVGGMGVDNIKKTKIVQKKILEKILKIKFNTKNLLINFHPETLNQNRAKKQIQEILKALKKLDQTSFFFTMPGAEFENKYIIGEIKKFIKKNKNSYYFKSLGSIKYFSLLNIVDAMIGNSSSGLLEMPSFKKATINLGNRQLGRLKGESVIDSKINEKKILSSIKKIYSAKFRQKLKKIKNPYGNGGSSTKIVKILEKVNFNKSLIKKFYDQ